MTKLKADTTNQGSKCRPKYSFPQMLKEMREDGVLKPYPKTIEDFVKAEEEWQASKDEFLTGEERELDKNLSQ